MNDDLTELQKILSDEDQVTRVSEFFRLMGDNSRLIILIALNHRELCVSDLVRLLNVSQPTVSHQLKLLRTAKLVKTRREGRTIYYTLDDEHIENIVAMAVEHALEK